MKTFAYIPQGRGGFLSKATIALGFDALYTDGFSTCNIVIFIGGDAEKTVFLFHLDLNSSMNEMKQYFDSLKEPKQIFILTHPQGKRVREEILIFFKQKITAKPVTIDIDNTIHAISASIQHNEHNSLHPFIKLWSDKEKPEVILHHPQEQRFLTVHKMEECIGIKHRAVTRTSRDKRLLIFNERFWEHIFDWEFSPDVKNAANREELALFSQNDPYITISNKLTMHVLSIRHIVPIGDDLKTLSLEVAIHIETYLHNYDYDAIFKKNMQDLLANKTKRTDYTPSTNEDKKLKEDITKILDTNSSSYLLIKELMNSYIKNAPSSEFKTCILDEFFSFCRHYENRKKYSDYQLERTRQLVTAERISDAAKKAYTEKKYNPALNLFMDELKYLTKYQINSHSSFAIAFHNLGRTAFRLGQFSEAKYFLNICLQLRKNFAESDIQKIQLTENALKDCDNELAKMNERKKPAQLKM